MKSQIAKLKNGDRVFARVIEVVAGNNLIFDFEGDLLRVSNESGGRLVEGDQVWLEVMAIQPLQFRVATRTEKLNLTI